MSTKPSSLSQCTLLALAFTCVTASVAAGQSRLSDGGIEFCDASVNLSSDVEPMTERYYSQVYRVETSHLTEEHNNWRKRSFAHLVPWQAGDKSRDGVWSVESVDVECHYYESAPADVVRNSRDRHIRDGNHARARLVPVDWPLDSVAAEASDGQVFSYGDRAAVPDGGIEFCDASVNLSSDVEPMTQRYYSQVYRVETEALTEEHNNWRREEFARQIPWQTGGKSRDGVWSVESVNTECHYYESAAADIVRSSRDRHIRDGNHARVRHIELDWPPSSVVAGDGQAISYGYFEDRDAHRASRLTLQFRDVSGAEAVVDAILRGHSVERNFEIRASHDIPNAAAYYDSANNRVLGYNPDFMRQMRQRTGSDWAGVSIMAHEIGHHFNDHLNPSEHTVYRASSRQFELQADRFSGGALHKLGATLEEAQVAMRTLGGTGSRTHPPMQERLNAIETGWMESYEALGNVGNAPTQVEPEGTMRDGPSRVRTPIEIPPPPPTRASRVPRVQRPTVRPPQFPMGARCYTGYGACPLPGVGAVGTPCHCISWYGTFPGLVGR